MPRFHQAVTGTLRRQGLAEQLTRLTERQFADVDHFLHFTGSFRRNLAGLDRDEFAQVRLVFLQQLAPALHDLAAHRRRDIAPLLEGFAGSVELAPHRGFIIGRHLAEFGTVDRRAQGEASRTT